MSSNLDRRPSSGDEDASESSAFSTGSEASFNTGDPSEPGTVEGKTVYPDFLRPSPRRPEIIDLTSPALSSHASSPQSGRAENIQTGVTAVDILAETISFVYSFEAMYGVQRPPFYMGTYREAKELAKSSAKLLAVYLHKRDSPGVDEFCTQILCSSQVVSFLEESYVVWGFDITEQQNCRAFSNTWRSEALDESAFELAPTLVVLAIFPRLVQPVCQVSVRDITNADRVFKQLSESVGTFAPRLEAAQKESAVLDDRQRLMRQQDIELEQSLGEDQRRIQQAKQQEVAKLEEENRRKENLERELTRRALLKSSLHPEPLESPAAAVCDIRFRLPDGRQLRRRFLMDDALQRVFDFIDSEGFSRVGHEYVTNFPFKNLAIVDSTCTLREAGILPQETVFVRAA